MTGPFEPTVSFITLGVATVGRAAAFYEALGLAPVRPPTDTVAFFQLRQGIVLALCPHPVLAHECGLPEDAPHTLGAHSHNVREEALVQAIVDRALHAGGTLLRPPSRTPWGALRAWIADPDGHRWELVHNPGIHRDPHGGTWLSTKDAPAGGELP